MSIATICEKGLVKFKDVSGEITVEDSKILFKYGKKFEGGVYVETGSYKGLSATIVSEAMGENSKIYCHDLWVDEKDWDKVLKGSTPPPKTSNIFQTFKDNMKKNNFDDRVIPMRGDSKETLHQHKDNSVDLCFIDGDHSVEGCYSDISILYDKLKHGGVMLGHDCETGSEVEKAVKKFCNENGIEYSVFKPKEMEYIQDNVPWIAFTPWWIFKIEKKEKFLYYNFWPTLAQHILDYPREHYIQAGVGQRHNNPQFYPKDVKSGEIVFVKTDLLEYFFEKMYPLIKTNFTLLSGIAGKDVEEKYKQYLDGVKIDKWIGTNIMWQHPKAMKIPIGFEEVERKGGDQNVLGRMYENRKSFKEKNDKLAITYLSDTHESRKNIKEFFKEKEYIEFLPKLQFEKYLDAINDNRFILCPRGCGTDTHRFWEVIFTGSIPVLETGGLDDLYSKFPCIIVNDFKEVSKDLLDNFMLDEEKVKNVDKYLLIKNLKRQILG